MKKTLLGIVLFFYSALVNAQGLENIIVERYYVSDLNDATVNSTGGIIPVGSVTYRIYVDMLPGYKFQAVYGVSGHEMRIQTSTLFFNNEDRGATSPTYTKTQASNNTVMIDSWLSVGAACAGNFGVLKISDDGIGTVVNGENPPVLQNADSTAGIPLMLQDGFLAGTPEQVTSVGIASEIAVFDNTNDGTNGPIFSTSNGSWASLNGSVGPDSSINNILIAQITTDGILSFELNVQIKSPNGVVEQYVAKDPVGNESLFPALMYSSLNTKIQEPNSIKPLFVVYPNPSNSKISLELMTDKKIANCIYKIYDSNGKVVIRKDVGKVSEYYSEYIDLSALTKGQYIIELILDGNSSSNKIVLN